MEITYFRWNNWNIEHIDKHHITPEEIESVAFDNEPLIIRGRNESRLMYGKTPRGRYILIVYLLQKGEAYVISSRDMSQREISWYKRRGK